MKNNDAHANKISNAPEPKVCLVFVYGTLKRGNRNNKRLDGSVYLGDASTAPKYQLFCLGYAPGMVEGGSCEIRGEVYAVTLDTLDALDGFEGHPWKYRRTMVTVNMADGGAMRVWTYVLVTRWVREHCGVPVPSGNWIQPEESDRIAKVMRSARRSLLVRDDRGGSLVRIRQEDARGARSEEDDWKAYADAMAEIEDEESMMEHGFCLDCADLLEDDGTCSSCAFGVREAIRRYDE